MEDHIKAWDRDYLRRGKLWGGAAKNLPDLPSGSKILEIGCGSGKTIASMPSNWNVAAIDVSKRAVEMARGFALGKIQMAVADARKLPFKDRSFDVVFAFHVTGHVLGEDRRRMAIESSRVLKDSGRLFFREFEVQDMRSGKGIEVEEMTFQRGEGEITHYFTEDEVIDLFSALEPLSIQAHKWKMRVRGRDLIRFELEAEFVRR